jgi:hypothetical protein
MCTGGARVHTGYHQIPAIRSRLVVRPGAGAAVQLLSPDADPDPDPDYLLA